MRLLEFIRARQAYVPASRTADRLPERIASGTAWAAGTTLVSAIIQFGTSTVFARLLAPSDFGLIAWADVAAQFVFIFANFGFNISIVQRRELDTETLSTVWWSSLVIDWSAALICAVVALTAHSVTQNPDVPWLMMLMALQFGVVAIGSVSEALMLRQFMFKEIAISNILCGIVCGFPVAYVLITRFGFGAMGLVISNVVTATAVALSRLYLVPWLPSLAFSRARCREQMAFGSSLLGYSLLGYVNQNIDRTTTGALLDKVQLGLFEYSGNIPRQVTGTLGSVLNRSLFPALAAIQHDPPQFRRLLVRFLRMTTLLIYPCLVGLALIAPEFVAVAYGPKWAPIVTPMRVICLTGLILLVSNTLGMVCNSLGRPDLILKASLALLIFNAAGTFGLILTWGLTGAAWSRGLVPALSIAFIWRWLGKVIGVSLGDLAESVGPAFGASFVMAVVVIAATEFWVPPVPTVALLAIKVVLGATVYLAAVWTGWREDANAVIGFAGRFLKQTAATPEAAPPNVEAAI